MMQISTGNFILSYVPNLTAAQFELIKDDPNVARSRMGKPWNEVINEHTSWITIHGEVTGDFIGAFMLDKVDEVKGTVCTHIMLRENYHRDTALTTTKLAAFFLRVLGMIPYTTVSVEPVYNYMRKFLEDCGFVHHLATKHYDIITIPTHYIPNLHNITIHNDGN